MSLIDDLVCLLFIPEDNGDDGDNGDDDDDDDGGCRFTDDAGLPLSCPSSQREIE